VPVAVSIQCQNPSLRQILCHKKHHSEYHFRVYRVSIISNLTERCSTTINIRLMRTLLLPPFTRLSSVPHRALCHRSLAASRRRAPTTPKPPSFPSTLAASRRRAPTPNPFVFCSPSQNQAAEACCTWRADGEPHLRTLLSTKYFPPPLNGKPKASPHSKASSYSPFSPFTKFPSTLTTRTPTRIVL
jgi:hypothetical protein